MEPVLKKITPTKEENKVLKQAADHFIKKLNSNLKGAKAILGGSAAKGTWLRGDYDIDIFVQFNQSFKHKDISEILHKKLKFLKKSVTKISGLRKVHGSRDYFQIRQDPFNFEIIPIIKINKSDLSFNITDISPLHTKWVKEKSDEKLLNEIRLTKAFCKANKLYGAESYIKGFSGYTLEILTIHYKSFQKLIKAALKWKHGLIIDIEKHKTTLNKSKLSPLIIIDPVQHSRNTSAVLSEQKFNLFIELAKKFTHNPSPLFFEKKSINQEQLKGALLLKAKPLSGKNDIVGAKLLKCFEYIARELEQEGYEITEHDWDWDNTALFWYFLKNKTLPEIKEHFGPPVKEREHVKKFRQKHKKLKLKTKNLKIYVELPRKHPNVNDFVKNLIKKDSYVLEKVKEINVIR